MFDFLFPIILFLEGSPSMTNLVYSNTTLTTQQLTQLLERPSKKFSPTIFVDVVDPQLEKITGQINIQLKSIPIFRQCVIKSELTADDMATALISKMRVAMEIFDDYCKFCKLTPNLLDEPKEMIERKIQDCEKMFQKTTLKNAALDYYHALEYFSLMDSFVEALKLTRASLTQSLILNKIPSGPAQNKVVYFALKLDELLDFSKDAFSNIAANSMNNSRKTQTLQTAAR